MVRKVAKKLAGLLVDDKTRIICVCGAPFVGKTWLTKYAISKENEDSIIIYDNIDTYERFVEIIEHRKEDTRKYVIVGRLFESKCRQIIKCDIAIEYVSVYPMSYDEFKLSIPKIYNLNDIEILNLYILVGGLPEIVKIFLETGDIEKVREGQTHLLEKLQKEIPHKAMGIVQAVAKDEVIDSTGFSIRHIDKNARNREYESVIAKLVELGILIRINRFAPREDKAVKKYKLYFYDIGIVSLINEFSIRDLTDRNESWKRKLLYNFYIRELRSYLDSEKEEIKYYCKDRAKAKLPIIIEMDETSGNKKLIPIVIKDGKDNIELYSRSTQVFMKEHINVSPINVPAPTYNQLQESSSLYNRIKNIT